VHGPLNVKFAKLSITLHTADSYITEYVQISHFLYCDSGHKCI